MWASLSLGARLLAGAALFITVALLVAGIAIGFLLHHFIQRQVDERLDTQIVFLASMLRADKDGRLALSGNADGPPFDRPGRGWYWQVSGPANNLRARALRAETLDVPALSPPPLPPVGSRPAAPPPLPADGQGPGGDALHFRVKVVAVEDVRAEIVATAPRAAVRGPLFDALTILGLALAALEGALLLAMLLQVRLGLRPLARLRDAVADVRAGRSERLPSDQPAEVRSLVAEMNALLEQNAANLERARRHVANLAHGLKTPLATLGLALSRSRDNEADLAPLVEVMDRRIRHHLGRARTAALAGPVRAQTTVAERLCALGAVLSKVNAARHIDLTIDVPPAAAVACEQQDFDEIAGNLLENAFKWAHRTVVVKAGAGPGRLLALTIEDDGHGLEPEQIRRVLQPGQRLDESAPGFGFGLSIVQELVELYGGTLEFARASAGGLRVVLCLPRAEAV